MNKVVKCAVFIFLFFLSAYINAQELFLKVKKGKVKYNDIILSEANERFAFKKNDVLVAPYGTMLLGRLDYKNTAYFDVPGGKTYKYQDLLDLSSSLDEEECSLFGSIFFFSFQNISPSHASSPRGDDREADYFLPSDDSLFQIIDDSFHLEIGNENTKLVSDLMVFDSVSGKIVYIGRPDSLKVKIGNLPEGLYNWTYTIQFLKDMSTVTAVFKNRFRVPSQSKKTELTKAYNETRQKLLGLRDKGKISQNLFEILIQEYKQMNHIYTEN